MSAFDSDAPLCARSAGSVELVISGNTKNLGDGFIVRRSLPAPERMTVGPFIFFDEMGPAEFSSGQGMNVRPHPHIGLATVTYLFAGEIMHRDSLGFEQPIEPGAINLMTAGKGIVHSERTRPDLLESGQYLHGIQTWMALPDALQEIDPAFVHYPSSALPQIAEGGVRTTVIIGSAYGHRSPVEVHADTLYLEQRCESGATSTLPDNVAERAIYVVGGSVQIAETKIEQGSLAIIANGPASFEAIEEAHVMVIGGEPFGQRHVKWNFVHASRERIDAAARIWTNGGFDRIESDEEFIPLPDDFFD